MNYKATLVEGTGNRFIQYFNSKQAAERAIEKLKVHGINLLKLEEVQTGKKFYEED